MTAGRAKDRSLLVLTTWSWGSIVGVLLLLALLAGFAYAWRVWQPAVAAQHEHPLLVEKLQITPHPDWIRAPVKREAFRDGSLGELSLADKDLTYKVFRAFEMHPWVAKVDRVSKHPDGQVFVDLHFRRPVAWVEIPSGMSSLDEAGVLPIDAEAVILPPEDLQGRIGDFLRISIPNLPPWGLKGAAWGDRRLLGAARLAGALEGVWKSLRLRRIRLVSDERSVRAETPQYELVTSDGARVLWGSAPGEEANGEAGTAEKRLRLKQLISNGLTNSKDIVDLRLTSF